MTDTDDTKTQPPKTAFSSKKFLAFVAITALAWVVFVQIIPRLNPQIGEPAQLLPVPAAENAEEAPDFSAPGAPPVFAEPPAPAPAEPVASVPVEPPPPAPPPLSNAKLDALEARLAQMEQRQQGAQSAVQLLLAYTELREAVQSGEPYVTALQRFEFSAAKHAAITEAARPLSFAAETGVPGLKQLRAEFDSAAAGVFQMDTKQAEGFWARLKSNLSTLVVVRRVGQQEGTTAEAVIARAEVALEQNDVASAHEELKGLPDAAKQPFAAWLAHAEAYLARGPALDALQRSVLAINLDTP